MVRDPVSLSKIFPTTSKVWWRRQTNMGTFLYIWWTCPLIQTLLRFMKETFVEMSRTSLTLTPDSLTIYSMLPCSRKSQKFFLLGFYLAATWQLIPRYWKSTSIPQAEAWIRNMHNLQCMEELRTTDTDSKPQLFNTWLLEMLYPPTNLNLV